ERRLLGLLRGGAQRAVRAAVEAAVQDDDVAARLRLAGELERRLDGLGARGCEGPGAARRALGQALRQPGHRLRVEEVADVDQLARLRADRLDDARGAVPAARNPTAQAG